MNIATASHIPLLSRAFALSNGDVCELGTGLYSTTILKWLCEMSDRKLFSYESSQKWFEKARKNKSPFQEIIKVDDWSKTDIEKPWGLAFVDYEPSEERVISIARLANYAEYIVIHDTNLKYDYQCHYDKIWGMFKYRFDDKWCEKCTTSIVSNFHSLERFE
jgi:hypothetical protein